MSLRSLLVKSVLVALLAAPIVVLAAHTINSYQDLAFGRERLAKIRQEAGKAMLESEAAKARANNLVNSAIKSWGSGPGEQRVLAAFIETDLTLEPVTAGQINSPEQGPLSLAAFKRMSVRGYGSPIAAKEALWNLGDLGPGVRLENFRGDYDSQKRQIVWTYSLLVVQPPSKSNSMQPVQAPQTQGQRP